MKALSYGLLLPYLALGIIGCGETQSDSSPIQVIVTVKSGPQLALVTPTSIVIAWRTGGLTTGRIEYGRDSSNPDMEKRDPAASREHVLELDELEPGTRYSYRLLAGERVLGGVREFSTAPADPEASVVFAVWGDSGVGNAAQFRVADAVLAHEPDLVLLTGDVIYGRGAPGEIDAFYFEPYRDLLDHIPFFPALGNHDVLVRGGQALLDALYLPRNDADGSEHFYSFDYGGVHFVALDSNQSLSSNSVQLRWFDRDLQRATALWRVVYFHHPLYSSSFHGSRVALRGDLGAVLDAHEVDLVLAGHDHDYERTFPIRGEALVDTKEEPDYEDPPGTIYVVTGGGGNGLYRSGRSFFTAYSESVHHFCLVEVEGATLILTAIRADGRRMDRVSIRKTSRR